MTCSPRPRTSCGRTASATAPCPPRPSSASSSSSCWSSASAGSSTTSSRTGDDVRIYFCSDIHASRKCWKKFLSSWRFYRADHIVVGGDITGKFVVPIVEAGGGRHTATFIGIERKVETPQQLEALRTRIADAGQYDFVTTPDELATYEGDQP